MKKNTIAALWLTAITSLTWAKEINAQVNDTIDEAQHKIVNVFKDQKRVDPKNTITFEEAQNLSQDTIKIQDIKNILKDKEFVNKFTNTECVNELLKVNNLNKDDVEKMIQDILNSENEEAQNLSQDTINIQEIKNLLNDKVLVDKLANDEGIKALLKEYNVNEDDAEKFIQDVLNSDITIWIVKKIMENQNVNEMEDGHETLAIILWSVIALWLVFFTGFGGLVIKRKPNEYSIKEQKAFDKKMKNS